MIGDDDPVTSTSIATAVEGTLMQKQHLQWTHLQLISFAIAPVVLLIVLLLKNDDWGAIANESTVREMHASASQRPVTMRGTLAVISECVNKAKKFQLIRQIMILPTKNETETKIDMIGSDGGSNAGHVTPIIVVG